MSVPFSPARYWSWRLRKHGEKVAALDPERHRNQREILLRETDLLANKAVAAIQIPTPWKRYTFGMATWTALAFQGLALGLDPAPIRHTEWLMIGVLFLALPAFGFLQTFAMWQHIRSERARFVRLGFPPTYRPRRDPWEQMWRDYQRGHRLDRAHQRAKRLERAGLIPPEWHPRAPHVRLWRLAKPKVRRVLFGV